MQAYVVGFIFDDLLTNVLLVTKARPTWQSGMLNGIGGHVESGESAIDAMIREAREEVGIESVPDDWTHIAHLEFPDGHVSFFFATDDKLIFNAKTLDDSEPISVFNVTQLQYLNTIPNLQFLIPLCIFYDYGGSGSCLTLPVVFNEHAV